MVGIKRQVNCQKLFIGGTKLNNYHNGFIWDLHLHTCKCTKPSKEFKDLSVEEYINELVDIYSKNELVKLIAFTDHNRISYDVITEFESRNLDIKVIPGVELDLYLSNEDKSGNDFKHLLFYFNINCKDRISDIDELNELFKKESPMLLNDVLDKLIEYNIEFVISPHFKKQDSRSIDYYWNDLTVTEKQSKKYLDQFFCFWESAGKSTIAKAKEFISEFYTDDRISIVQFSDGNNFNKIREYVLNPPQYFRALPSFQGLRIVGSDCRRIDNESRLLSIDEKSGLLGIIEFSGNLMYLTNGLNAIIGGRGSGKSILADKIALHLDTKNEDIFKGSNDSRLKFLRDLPIKIYNMNNTEIKPNSFEFDYYNQGYISTLFTSNKVDMKKVYFKSEFDKLKDNNNESIKGELITKFNEIFEEFSEKEIKDNLSSLSSKLKIVSFLNKPITLKSSSHKFELLTYTKYSDLFVRTFVKSLIPNELRTDKDLIESFVSFYKQLLKSTKKYNDKQLDDQYLIEKIGSTYDSSISSRNQEFKTKVSTLKLVQDKIHNSTVHIINRVNIINSYISISRHFKSTLTDSIDIKCFGDDVFTFVKTVNIEHPLKYFFRVFDKYFDSIKTKIKIGDFYTHLHDAISKYCFEPEKFLKDAKTLGKMDMELKTFGDILINITSKILFSDGITKVDLDEQSPGTKANMLMEYIAYKDTRIPLIIDQPEDNVDNYTIFNKLTSWFETMKTRRQIIVVTHDANIVVNSDSENIIVTKYIDNKFIYSYGSFEFPGNIDSVSNILEGGIKAIERRLKKYGN